MIVPIQFRVLNTIKSWMNNYYTGVTEDPILLEIKRWAKDALTAGAPSQNCQAIIVGVESQMKQISANSKVSIVTIRQNIPIPILPKKLPRDGRGLKLLDIDPEEVARQITIRQMNLYLNIKVVDCLDKGWTRDKASSVNNIKKMIQYDNKVLLPRRG